MSTLVTNNATSTLASSVSSGGTSLSLSVGEGSSFPAISNKKIDFFYIRVGGDDDNEVVKCTARSSDTLTCSAITHTGGWPSGTEVTLTVCGELINTFPRIINEDITITIAATGGTDYTYIEDALVALKNTRIADGKTVTINVTGHHAPLLSDEGIPDSDKIHIVGTTYTAAINSVQSTTGSSGSRSIVLNMSSVSNISVGDFIACSSLSGGTNPNCLLGAHEVTNVDVPNTRITVFSSHYASYAASGAVTGSVTILKTVFDCSGYSGIIVQGSGFQVDKVAFKGNGTHSGIYASNPKAKIEWNEQTAIIVFSGFKSGINLAYGAALQSVASVFISNCDTGVLLKAASVANMPYLIISGCYLGIELGQAVFSTINGYNYNYVNANSPHIYGCDTGVYAEYGSKIRVGGDIKDSLTKGIEAFTYSYVDAVSATMSGNTVDCSPTANSQGNTFAYIDT